jgi:hypothetical protein
MHTGRIASTASSQSRSASRCAAAAALIAAAAVFVTASPAHAIHVGTTNNVVPNTATNPASTPGWTDGDPGFANHVRFGYLQQNGDVWYQSNGVYIGDGWLLTAAHVGVPYRIQLDNGATFDPIPGQNFQVANPVWNDGRLVQPLSDLRMIRINGDPGLPALTIASQPFAINDQVMFIGSGVVRAATQSHFSVNTVPQTWQWTPNCTSGCNYHGYYTDGFGKRWGTNRIANSDTVLGEGDGNLQTVVGGGSIAYVTTYDQFSGDTFESQAVGGDSGSSVFYKRNGQWQLAGIMLANYVFSGQNNLDPSNTLAVFGNADGFADLSAYNATGNSKIQQLMNAHVDYSSVADINLDGAAGTAADIAAFVAGWNYNNGTGLGTITSWKNGDVTHDGKTDVADFLRVRTGLTPGAGAELGALLGVGVSGGIPEPSSILLLIVPSIYSSLRGRQRRRHIS